MIVNFEKTQEGQWYVVLPNYEGDKEDLEMVDGADKLLDRLSDGDTKCTIEVSIDSPLYGTFIKSQLIDHNEFGATYITNEEPLDENSNNDNMFWLCNVTHIIFGEHPLHIYFKKINNDRKNI